MKQIAQAKTASQLSGKPANFFNNIFMLGKVFLDNFTFRLSFKYQVNQYTGAKGSYSIFPEA